MPKGRLAPSPTGYLHLGNAFAFMCAWLGAAGSGAGLVMRVEDIDPDRSRAEYVRAMLEDLSWLGIGWDEGVRTGGVEPGGNDPYTQSKRLHLYEAALSAMHAHGLLYPCFCTRKELRLLASAPHIGDEGAPYPGTCRCLGAAKALERIAGGARFSLRLDAEKALAWRKSGKTLFSPPETENPLEPEVLGLRDFTSAIEILSSFFPGVEVFGRDTTAPPASDNPFQFNDLVLGKITFSIADCGGDFALRRSDGVHAYQLAAALDDAAMGITQVVRGEDLVSSTPRQLLVFHLMGAAPPEYAHIPLVHNRQGERLAKRHASLELRALREKGTRPEEIIGLLAGMSGLVGSTRPAALEEILPVFSFPALAGKKIILPY